MGYRHIDNLYKDQSILMFRECFALEKIHGTSASVQWREGRVQLSSGGEKHERFASLFDEAKLIEAFALIGHPFVVVYGEAYGGSQQAQKWRYGELLRFIAFEVAVGETWLAVPQAHDLVTKLGLDFVHYVKVSTDLTVLDAEKRRCVDSRICARGLYVQPCCTFENRTNSPCAVRTEHVDSKA